MMYILNLSLWSRIIKFKFQAISAIVKLWFTVIFFILNQPVAILVAASSKPIKVTNDLFILYTPQRPTCTFNDYLVLNRKLERPHTNLLSKIKLTNQKLFLL